MLVPAPWQRKGLTMGALTRHSGLGRARHKSGVAQESSSILREGPQLPAGFTREADCRSRALVAARSFAGRIGGGGTLDPGGCTPDLLCQPGPDGPHNPRVESVLSIMLDTRGGGQPTDAHAHTGLSSPVGVQRHGLGSTPSLAWQTYAPRCLTRLLF